MKILNRRKKGVFLFVKPPFFFVVIIFFFFISCAGNPSRSSFSPTDNYHKEQKQSLPAQEDFKEELIGSEGQLMSDSVETEQETHDEDEDYLEDEFEDEDVQIRDPLYVWNKGMYHFNDKFYFWVLKPATRVYSFAVPEDFRLAFSNFYKNISTPIRFVNNLLQLKMKSAGTELLRFAVNTTFGVFGFADIARSEFDLKIQKEDLGQTLGTYGIGQGIYIVWPIVGPSTLRDSVGLIGDRFLHPFSSIGPTETSLEVSAGTLVHETVNKTSFRIGDYEALKEAAIDPYTAIRDAYIQNRKKAVEE